MNIKLLLSFACTILASGHLGVLAQSNTYDLSRDFSIAANSNSVWSYGWKSNLTGGFTRLLNSRTSSFDTGSLIELWELAYAHEPMVARNSGRNTGFSDGGQGVFPPGTVWFSAGFDGSPQNFAVIRLTVPAQGAGTYRLESAARCYLDGDTSGDTDYHVVVNGVEVFSQFLAPSFATGYTNTLSLAAGDTVDFLVGRGADGRKYGSGLKIQATLSQQICTPHKARATAELVNGFVVGATITDSGCGYTNAPLVSI